MSTTARKSSRYPGGHYDPLLGETLERMAADQVEFLARHLSAGEGPEG